MSLSKNQITSIETTIAESLRKKFKRYNPETKVMPFHTKLLGKDRLALYSFIQSLNTSFGVSIFEPVAVSLASCQFKTVQHHIKSGTEISTGAHREIQKIMDELTAANKTPDKKSEISRIRHVCQQGEMTTVKPTLVDVYLETNQDEIYLFDIKTAKPNKGDFKEFKRTLLEWSAAILSKNPQAKINTLIAIPYNPYAPAPYNRWTMAGMLDLKEELMVAEVFWDFLGGTSVYHDLLDCFEHVGIKMRNEIDEYFAQFMI